jgi:hypothetical protein
MITTVHWSSCKVSVVVCRFDHTGIISTDFQKVQYIFNPTKVRPVGAELFSVDGRTDGHDKANSHFSQLCLHTLKMQALMLLAEEAH